MAVTSSGDATKQCVAGLPSLRAAKLRLNDVMMELASPLATSVRFHWPMHGPHELDSTVPPILANVSIMPSRSIVARICSEPGEMVNGTLALMPAASACFAMDAARAMSSYEELVHEPMSAALSSRVRQVGREGPVDVRLQLAQVHLNQLVVAGALVGAQVVAERVCQLGGAAAVCRHEVVVHALIVREHGRRRANLGAHVADGGHAGARHGLHTWAKVLDNGAGATLDGEDASDLEDDVLGGRPLGQLAGELDTNNLGRLELPRQAGHHVNSIRTTHTHGAHAQAACIGRVAISANHHEAWCGIVLQHDLVDDARARLPEAHAILGASACFRSATPPKPPSRSGCGDVVPSIRWSQWMVDGTMALGSPDEMNCSMAICAVASCMATRSARAACEQGLL
eukprot:361570-Chlamydomonas_euryale.AAC.6